MVVGIQTSLCLEFAYSSQTSEPSAKVTVQDGFRCGSVSTLVQVCKSKAQSKSWISLLEKGAFLLRSMGYRHPLWVMHPPSFHGLRPALFRQFGVILLCCYLWTAQLMSCLFFFFFTSLWWTFFPETRLCRHVVAQWIPGRERSFHGKKRWTNTFLWKCDRSRRASEWCKRRSEISNSKMNN